MFIESVPSEIVYQISDQEQRQILQKHFNLLYIILAENHPVPGAVFETQGDIQRGFSGIAVPYHNAILGSPEEAHWDVCIDEQMSYFKEAKVPFVWYVDEDSHPAFKERLLQRGFQDGGIFRGMIGMLDKPISLPELPDGYVLEMVENEPAMEEFNELLCATFGFEGENKEQYKKVMWNAQENEMHPIFHWVARKEGKVVSVLSTIIEGSMVSFWNMATLPELRRQGVSSALYSFASQHAISRGCRLGSAYLMADGMALGICSKFGYQTKWRFNAYLSPL